MRCDRFQELTSARLDGEILPEEELELDAHLSTCAACSATAAEMTSLHRAARLRPAVAVPDFAEAILARAHPPTPGRLQWIRWSVALLGAYGVYNALPDLLYGHEQGADVHIARHLGSFSLALTIGLLFAAWQPTRAYGLLPVAASLAAAMVGTAVIDRINGHATMFGELHHWTQLAGLFGLWMLAGYPIPRSLHRRRQARPPYLVP